MGRPSAERPSKRQIASKAFSQELWGQELLNYYLVCNHKPGDIIMTTNPKASDMQVGGNHYKDMTIQPGEFIHANGLGWYEGNAVKYICRHKIKGREEDIKKAIHYLELLLEKEYGDNHNDQ